MTKHGMKIQFMKQSLSKKRDRAKFRFKYSFSSRVMPRLNHVPTLNLTGIFSELGFISKICFAGLLQKKVSSQNSAIQDGI